MRSLHASVVPSSVQGFGGEQDEVKNIQNSSKRVIGYSALPISRASV